MAVPDMWGLKPEWGLLELPKMWGVSVPPESPPMKPEGGRFPQVAENQNG